MAGVWTLGDRDERLTADLRQPHGWFCVIGEDLLGLRVLLWHLESIVLMCESVRAVGLTPISFLHWKPIKVWHIWWSHLLSKTGTNLTAGGEIQQLLTSKDAVMYEIDTFHWFSSKTLKRKNELCYNFNGDGFSNELMSLCNIWNGNFRLGFTKTLYLRGMIDFNNRWNDCVMEAHWTAEAGIGNTG